MRIPSLCVTAASVAAALAIWAPSALAAAQPKPDLVGRHRDWFVYSSGTGANKVCYALGQPKDSTPKNVNRNPIFFLISTWPGQKKQGEPSVVPGYPYKEGSKVEIQIGGNKFQLFTKNERNAGGAWMEDPADERRLLDAMKGGANMVVIGTSTRGTLTRDTYSLAGITAALTAVEDACE
jgi:hypothetical protein